MHACVCVCVCVFKCGVCASCVDVHVLSVCVCVCVVHGACVCVHVCISNERCTFPCQEYLKRLTVILCSCLPRRRLYYKTYQRFATCTYVLIVALYITTVSVKKNSVCTVRYVGQ